jgi:hypothetical protein
MYPYLHGMSSDCEWRGRRPYVEGSRVCTEQVGTGSQQEMTFLHGVGAYHVTQRHNGPGT